MNRTVDLILPASESHLPGDFVVHRSLPGRELRRVGGFVFLDHFDEPDITPELFAVPPHPHVVLQTVTNLYEGEILHTDSLDDQQKIHLGDEGIEERILLMRPYLASDELFVFASVAATFVIVFVFDVSVITGFLPFAYFVY